MRRPYNRDRDPVFIEIEPNPNCEAHGFFAFEESGEARAVKALRMETQGGEEWWDVTGVDTGGKFVNARTQKVADSGAGYGFLIFGGAWGIRLKPSGFKEEWDLKSARQKGEAYVVFAEETDIR